jgi:hypothetical protein
MNQFVQTLLAMLLANAVLIVGCTVIVQQEDQKIHNLVTSAQTVVTSKLADEEKFVSSKLASFQDTITAASDKVSTSIDNFQIFGKKKNAPSPGAGTHSSVPVPRDRPEPLGF